MHRVGRTGRYGSYGVAITLISEEEKEEMKLLKEAIGYDIVEYDRSIIDTAKLCELSEKDKEILDSFNVI